MFLLALYEASLSRSGRGGTILVYATHVGHLIKYCFANSIDFPELTDGHFSHFVRGLQARGGKGGHGARARNDTTVVQIGRTCLRFLEFVGPLYGIDHFVGPEGVIRAQRKSFFFGSSGRGNSERVSWSHASFPLISPMKRGMPISRANIEKINDAILDISSSTFLIKRRLALILMLEITGGRRSEVNMLTTRAVREALSMPSPMLTLVTIKRGGNRFDERKVPVPASDLLFVQEYIEKNRSGIIRRTIGTVNDHGRVFVSERSGRPLTSEYLGAEIWNLRRAAGIETKCHAHQFRHRFITRIFIEMVKMHEFEAADDFRRALLNTSALRQRLKEWTGHKNINTLDHYIDLAFDELSNFDETLTVLANNREVQSFASQVTSVADELLSGGNSEEAAIRLKKMAAFLFQSGKAE